MVVQLLTTYGTGPVPTEQERRNPVSSNIVISQFFCNKNVKISLTFTNVSL